MRLMQPAYDEGNSVTTIVKRRLAATEWPLRADCVSEGTGCVAVGSRATLVAGPPLPLRPVVRTEYLHQ
jgi:hypothetical protein